MIAVHDLTKRFGGFHAVDGVSLRIETGSITGLIGPNGAGKSTLFNVIAGVLPPTSGRVEMDGQDITGLPPHALFHKGLLRTFQLAHEFSSMTVRENLMMGAYLRRDRDGVAQDLERVYGYFPRLKERLGQPAGQLSGGEQQMLAIGRALMNRPTLLLLDEPSLGLSPILVKEIFTIIRRVNQEHGMSILLVEQNAKIALETAHYGYVLEIGRVVMNDTCERLMSSPDIQEFYLGAKEAGARGERRWKKKKTWR